MSGVDGGILREWRRSRGWNRERMARELIKAAGNAGVTVTGLESLTSMVGQWERNYRRPREMYWLLYLRIFQPPQNGVIPHNPGTAAEMAAERLQRAAEFPSPRDIDAMEAAALRARGGVPEAEIRAMAAALRDIQEQVDALTRRLAELAGEDFGRQP
jgi:transcriptional regulator with XRE-family HTH domain